MRRYAISRFPRIFLLTFCLLLLLALSACAGLPGGGGTGNATPTTGTQSGATAQPTLPALPTVPTVNPNQPLNANLIANGNAEAGAGSPDDSSLMPMPGWTRQGNFNIMQYQSDAGNYQGMTSPGPSDRGKNFFYGGFEADTDNTVTSATQTIDVSAAAPLLSSNQVKFTLSAWLGGYADQDDNATLKIQFLSATGQALGSASLGPVLNTERNGDTGLALHTTSGSVPAGTVKISVTLTMTKTAGSDNDGSADDLSLIFHL